MKKLASDLSNGDSPPYYQFKIFAPFSDQVNHAVSSRKHGSLDATIDGPIEERNRHDFGKLSGISHGTWCRAHQTHSDIIHCVQADQELPHKFEEGDALITDARGVGLFVKMADCQAILIFDPKKHVIAAVHSGWRGSLKNIIGKTVKLMKSKYACNPSDLRVGISYSLGPCCCEFTNPFHELPKEFHKYILQDGRHVDFWRASIDQLTSSGVEREHIELAGICTKCNINEFYSYRSEGEDAGRMGALISLI